MTEVTSNICAGPFGVFYDFYIERPWLAQLVGRMAWGIDVAPLYRSMAALAALSDDVTVLDVPCGGGVALRALRPRQRLRWIAVDIEPKMLARCERRARDRDVAVELVRADMRALPLPSASADVVLAYSGLHMVEDAGQAVAERAARRDVRRGGQPAPAAAAGARRAHRPERPADRRRRAAPHARGRGDLRRRARARARLRHLPRAARGIGCRRATSVPPIGEIP
jgi:SAM-dependent methyltransferase